MSSAIRSTLIGLAAAGVLLPGLAAAQAKDGYLTDSGGRVVKAAGAGVCVRSSQWTPALAIAECDPYLVKKPMAQKAEPMKPAPPVTITRTAVSYGQCSSRSRGSTARGIDRKSTRLNSSHMSESRMPSSA